VPDIYAGSVFGDRTELLQRFRADNPRYTEWGDKSLYSVMALNDPSLPKRVQKDADPDFKDGSQFLAAYRQGNPAAQGMDDATLGSTLVQQMPELQVFGFGKPAAAEATPVEAAPVVSPFEVDFRSRHPQWIGPAPKGEIAGLRGADVYQEIMAANAEGRAGFGEGFGGNWESMVPFYGTAKAAIDVGRLALTARKMQNGEEVSDQEKLDLNIFLADQDRDANATILGKAGAIVAGSFGFAGEFAATAAMGAGLSAMAARGGTQVAKSAVQKFAASWAKQRVWDAAADGAARATGKFMTRNVGQEAMEAYTKGRVYRGATGAAGAAARMAVGGAVQTGVAAGVQLAASGTTAAAAETELYAALENKPMDRGRAFAIGLGKELIERSSEFTGGSLLNGAWLAAPASWQAKFAKFASDEATRLATRLPREAAVKAANETAKTVQRKWAMGMFLVDFAKKHSLNYADAAKSLVKVGYNGVLEEAAEERLGGFLHGLFGTDGTEGGLRTAIEGALPTSEEAVAELLAFSMPLAAVKATDMAQKHLSGVFGNDVVGTVAAVKKFTDPAPIYVDTTDGKRDAVTEATVTAEEADTARKFFGELAEKGQEAGAPGARLFDVAMSVLTLPLHGDPTRIMYGSLERALTAETGLNVIDAYRRVKEARIQAGATPENAAKDARAAIEAAVVPAFMKRAEIRRNLPPELQEEMKAKLQPGQAQPMLGSQHRGMMESPNALFSDALNAELVRQGFLVVKPISDNRTVDKDDSVLRSLVEEYDGIDKTTPEGQRRLIELAISSGAVGVGQLGDFTDSKFVDRIDARFKHLRTVRQEYGDDTTFHPGMQVRHGKDLFVVVSRVGDVVNVRRSAYDGSQEEMPVDVKQFSLSDPARPWSKVRPYVYHDRSSYYGTKAEIEALPQMKGYNFDEVANRMSERENADGTTVPVYSVSFGMTNWKASDGVAALRWRPEVGPYSIVEDMVVETRARFLFGSVSRAPGAMDAMAKLDALLREMKSKKAVEAGVDAKGDKQAVAEATRDLDALISAIGRGKDESEESYRGRVDEIFGKLALQMEAGYDYASYAPVEHLPYQALFSLLKTGAYAQAWGQVRQDFINAMDKIAGEGWQSRYANPFTGLVEVVKPALVKEAGSVAAGKQATREQKSALKENARDKKDEAAKEARETMAPTEPKSKPVTQPNPNLKSVKNPLNPPKQQDTESKKEAEANKQDAQKQAEAALPEYGMPDKFTAPGRAGVVGLERDGTTGKWTLTAPNGDVRTVDESAARQYWKRTLKKEAPDTVPSAPTANLPPKVDQAAAAAIAKQDADLASVDAFLADDDGKEHASALLAERKNAARRLDSFLDYLEKGNDERALDWPGLIDRLRAAQSQAEIDAVVQEMVDRQERIGILRVKPSLMRFALQVKYRQTPEVAKEYANEIKKSIGDLFDRTFGTEAPTEDDEEQGAKGGDLDAYNADRRLDAMLEQPALAVFTALTRRFFTGPQLHLAVAKVYRDHAAMLDKAILNETNYRAFLTSDLSGDSSGLRSLQTALRAVPHGDAVTVFTNWLTVMYPKPLATLETTADGSAVTKVKMHRNASSFVLLRQIRRALTNIFNDPMRLQDLDLVVGSLESAIATTDREEIAKAAVSFLQAVSDETGEGLSSAATWEAVGSALRAEDSEERSALLRAVNGVAKGLRKFVLAEAEASPEKWATNWAAALNTVMLGGSDNLAKGSANAFNGRTGMPNKRQGRSAFQAIVAQTSMTMYAESAATPVKGSRKQGYAPESAMNGPGKFPIVEVIGLTRAAKEFIEDIRLRPEDADTMGVEEIEGLQKKLYARFAASFERAEASGEAVLPLYLFAYEGAKNNLDMVEIPVEAVLGKEGKPPATFEEAFELMSAANESQFSLPTTVKEARQLYMKRKDKYRSGGQKMIDVEGGVTSKTAFVIDADAPIQLRKADGSTVSLPAGSMFDGVEYLTPSYSEKTLRSYGLWRGAALKATVVSDASVPSQYYDKGMKLTAAPSVFRPLVAAVAAAGYDAVNDTATIKALSRKQPATLEVTLANKDTVILSGFREEVPWKQERLNGVFDSDPLSHLRFAPLPIPTYGLMNLGDGSKRARLMLAASDKAPVMGALAESLRDNMKFSKPIVNAMGGNAEALAYPVTRSIVLTTAASSVGEAAPTVWGFLSVVVPSGGYVGKDKKTAYFPFGGEDYYSMPYRGPDGKVMFGRARANIADPGFRYEAVVPANVNLGQVERALQDMSPKNAPDVRAAARDQLSQLLRYEWEGRSIPVPSTVSFDDLYDANGEFISSRLVFDGAAMKLHPEALAVLMSAPRMLTRTPDGPNAHVAQFISAPFTFRDAGGNLKPGIENWHAVHPLTTGLRGVDQDGDKDLNYGAAYRFDAPTRGYTQVRSIDEDHPAHVNAEFTQSLFEGFENVSDWDLNSSIDTSLLENTLVNWEGAYETVKKLSSDGVLPPTLKTPEEVRALFNTWEAQRKLWALSRTANNLKGVIVAQYAAMQMVFRYLGLVYPESYTMTFKNLRTGAPDAIKVSRPVADPNSDRVVALAFMQFVNIAIDDPSKQQVAYLLMNPDTMGLFQILAAGHKFEATTLEAATKEIQAFYQQFVDFLQSPEVKRLAEVRKELAEKGTRADAGEEWEALMGEDGKLPSPYAALREFEIWNRRLQNLTQGLLSFKKRPSSLSRLDAQIDAVATMGGFEVTRGGDAVVELGKRSLARYGEVYMGPGSLYAREDVREMADRLKKGDSFDPAKRSDKPYADLGDARVARFTEALEQAVMIDATANALPEDIMGRLHAAALASPDADRQEIGRATDAVNLKFPALGRTLILTAGPSIASAAMLASPGNVWWQNVEIAKRRGEARISAEFQIRQNESLTDEFANELQTAFDKTGEQWVGGKLQIKDKDGSVAAEFTRGEVMMIMAWYALQNEGAASSMLQAMSPAFHRELATRFNNELKVGFDATRQKYLIGYIRKQTAIEYRPQRFSTYRFGKKTELTKPETSADPLTAGFKKTMAQMAAPATQPPRAATTPAVPQSDAVLFAEVQRKDPGRLAWISQQIDSGALDGKTLYCYAHPGVKCHGQWIAERQARVRPQAARITVKNVSDPSGKAVDDPNGVYIGRPGRLGNPFGAESTTATVKVSSAAESTEVFGRWLAMAPEKVQATPAIIPAQESPAPAPAQKAAVVPAQEPEVIPEAKPQALNVPTEQTAPEALPPFFQSKTLSGRSVDVSRDGDRWISRVFLEDGDEAVSTVDEATARKFYERRVESKPVPEPSKEDEILPPNPTIIEEAKPTEAPYEITETHGDYERHIVSDGRGYVVRNNKDGKITYVDGKGAFRDPRATKAMQDRFIGTQLADLEAGAAAAPEPETTGVTEFLPSEISSDQILLGNGNMVPGTPDQMTALARFDEVSSHAFGDAGRAGSTTVIMGRPGVGKTTILNEALRRIRLRYGDPHGPLPGGLYLATPTHMASGVVGMLTTFWHQISWANRPTRQRPAVLTTAALLGARPEPPHDKRTGRPDAGYAKRGSLFYPSVQAAMAMRYPPDIAKARMVVVDESSMLQDGELELLKEWQKQRGVELVFLGDSAQLPPVREGGGVTGPDIGSVFRSGFKADKVVELTQVMRQGTGNPLLNVLERLRKAIFAAPTEAEKATKLPDAEAINPKTGEGYASIGNGATAFDALKASITVDLFRRDPLALRVYSPTNWGVRQWNERVFAHLFPQEAVAGQRVAQGAVVRAYANVNLADDMAGEARAMQAFLKVSAYSNSDDFVVTKVGPAQKLGGPVPAVAGLAGRFVELEAAVPGDRLTGETTNRVFLVDATQGKALVAAIQVVRSQMASAFQARDWNRAWPLRDLVSVLTAGVVNFDTITGAGVKSDAETTDRAGLPKAMDLGYASTIHKGQGATNRIAIVDTGAVDAAKKFPLFTRLQLLYVGLSRASKAAIAVQPSTTSRWSAETVAALRNVLDQAGVDNRPPPRVEKADDYGGYEERASAQFATPDTADRGDADLSLLNEKDQDLVDNGMDGPRASALSAVWNLNYSYNRFRHLGFVSGGDQLLHELADEWGSLDAWKDHGMAEINRIHRIYGSDDGVLYEMLDLDTIRQGKRPFFSRGKLKVTGHLDERQQLQAEMFRWIAAALREYRDDSGRAPVADLLDKARNEQWSDERLREAIDPYLDKAMVTWGHQVRDPHVEQPEPGEVDADGNLKKQIYLPDQELARTVLDRFMGSEAHAELVKAGRRDGVELDWFADLKALDKFYEGFPAKLKRLHGYVQHQWGVGFRDTDVRAAEKMIQRELGNLAVPAASPLLSDSALLPKSKDNAIDATQIALYNRLTGNTFTQSDFYDAGVTKVQDLNALIASELHKHVVTMATAKIRGQAIDEALFKQELELLRKLKDLTNEYGFREWAPPMLRRRLDGSYEDIYRLTSSADGRSNPLMPATMDFLRLRQTYLTQTVTAIRNRDLARKSVLSQDEDGMPGIIMIPSEGKDVLALLPRGVQVEMGLRWAKARGKAFNPTADIRGQLIALEGELNPDEWATYASPFPSVDRIRVRKGSSAEAALKHWIERPMQWRVHGTDLLERLMHITQWGKMLGVGHSLFFAVSVGESAAAGSGLENNLLWGKDLTGTYKGRGPQVALRKMKDLALLQAAGDPELADFMYKLGRAGIETGGEIPLDMAAGMFDRDLHGIIEAIGDAHGEKAKERARQALHYLSGRYLSERFFGKPGVRGGLFQASKVYLTDQMARQVAKEQGEEWDKLTDRAQIRILRQIAPFINAAYGGDNWRKYWWSTPRVVQFLNLALFAPQWTWAAFNVAGGGLLTGGLLGNHMSSMTRRLTLRNAVMMWALVLGAIPAMVQAAVYATAAAMGGGGDPDDHPFPEQNEAGRKTYIDVTPMVRMMPGYQGDPTGKRRVYIRFGKQAWEVYNGWLTKPIDTALGKMSVPAKIVYEQITGTSPGSDWTLEFNGRGLAGFIAAPNRDGEMTFMKSRLGYTVQKFLPMSVMSSIANQDSGLLPLIAPVSHGKSQGAATADLVMVLNTVAEDTTWKYARKTPGVVENLRGLGNEIIEGARINGYDTDKIVTTAKSVVLGRLYKEFSAALNDNDTVLMDRIANRILRVGGTIRGLKASVTARRAGANKTPSQEELAAIEAAMQ
jgi:hypothetical protein